MRRRGFSLLEILVVIAVILFLIAVMFAALTKLRARTAMGQAKNLVEKCSSALETYKLHFRDYPDATLGGKTGSENLYYFLATPFRQGAVVAKGEVEATINVGPLLPFEEEQDLKKQGTKTFVVDPWRNPLVFKINLIKDANLFDIKIPVIYSFGINGADNNGGGDDILVGK